MGALIRTKGTIRLARHFSEEFSIFMPVYRTNASLFDTTATTWQDLLNVTNTLTDSHSPRTDQKCLLPPRHPMHKNLETRWLWFLTTGNAGNGSLTLANHNAIADSIHQALIDSSFSCITFDVVETSGAQSVAATTLKIQGLKYMEIVLQTQAMPTGPVVSSAPPAVDYQFPDSNI